MERRAYLSATIAFGSAVSFTAGTSPVALATADFNGDGNADLAVADALTEKVNIFYGTGTGTGTFTAGPVLSLSAPPTAMITGDFNGDGLPDIAVAAAPGSTLSGSTTVTVFLDSAAGTFGVGATTTVETGVAPTEPIAIAAADFNGDGHLDLVATESADSAVAILLGTGSGTFGTPIVKNVGELPTAVATGDFNGDGHPDVAVADTLTVATGTTTGNPSDGMQIILGGGNGQFSAGSIAPLSASGSTALAVGDLTGDGKDIDLAVGNADGTVTLLVNQGSGTFVATPSTTVAAASTGIAIADLNLDGHGDVVTADGGTALSSGADAVTVLPGAGSGTLGTAEQFPVDSLPEGVVVADFNGDGKPDIATVNEGAGTVDVLLNTTAVTTITTRTTLAVDSATTAADAPVTLTATVKPTAVSTLTGESFPTGTVNFYDGTTLIGSSAPVKGAVSGTATATLAVSTLTVGTHKLTAKYAADTAYGASASTATTEVITATATEGPDLVATFSSVSLPPTVAPGESGSVQVKVTNQGNATATGPVTNGLFLSLDDTYDLYDTPVTLKGSLARANLKLAAGKSITLAGTFAVPTDVPLGSYVLLVDLNTAGGVSESNATNNVTASPTAYTVADQFGTVGGKKGIALQLAQLPDGTGTVGTFKLSGPGTGTLDVGDDGVDLTLNGTTAASAVTITTAKGATFQLHDLVANTAVGTLRAPTVDINGIGAVTLTGGANTVTLGTLLASVTADAGVRSLSVASWVVGNLSAPWVGTLRSAGPMGASVTLSGTGAPRGVALATLAVGGYAASDISVVGSVGTVSVGGYFAGDVSVIGSRLAAFRVVGGMTGAVRVSAGPIGSVIVGGTVASGAIFAATGFPKRAILGGVAVDPATDSHFQTSQVAVPLAG